MGGLRTANCANCGAKIGVSWLSSFVLFSFGTWIPVAGAAIGAIMAAGNNVLIGGAVGLVLSFTVFAALYFRGAKLIII